MQKTPTPNGARLTEPFDGAPSSAHSRDPEASCGLIVTGSAAWLTSQANWLPSSCTRTSAATRGSSTVTSRRTPAWIASASYSAGIASGLTSVVSAAMCSMG